MLIFRSEDHVRNWSFYNPELEDAIMPIADWAQVFSTPLFRNRLQADYLAKVQEYTKDYRGEMLRVLESLGKASGPFWQTG